LIKKGKSLRQAKIDFRHTTSFKICNQALSPRSSLERSLLYKKIYRWILIFVIKENDFKGLRMRVLKNDFRDLSMNK